MLFNLIFQYFNLILIIGVGVGAGVGGQRKIQQGESTTEIFLGSGE